MDFAKKILNKYGWKEGDGLGKNNNGIAKPLKASLKFDNSGLGADQAASDFNNHWWDRIYNEATQNIDIKKCENGKVSIELKEADAVEISTKNYSTKKLKKAKQKTENNVGSVHYSNFLQMTTLSNGGSEIENQNKISTDDISVTQFKILSDDELFKACGGRTAHKGARHGLKLSGKLARLEQQEQALLEKMKKSKTQEMEKNLKANIFIDEQVNSVDKKLKKLKKKSKIVDEDRVPVAAASDENNEEVTEYLKAKKKRRHTEVCDNFSDKNLNIGHSLNIEINNLSEEEIGVTTVDKKPTKKKRRKSCDINTEPIGSEDILVEENQVHTKKKRQKTEDESLSNETVPNTISDPLNESLQKNKKKKKKSKIVDEECTNGFLKKSKKKKNNIDLVD